MKFVIAIFASFLVSTCAGDAVIEPDNEKTSINDIVDYKLNALNVINSIKIKRDTVNPNYSSGCVAQKQEQLIPTVKPVTPFNAEKDAEELYKAMNPNRSVGGIKLPDGVGTNDADLINILTKRSNSQRQEIANKYKIKYGHDLISDLKEELSGDYEHLVIALMTPLPSFLAKELHHALEHIGLDKEKEVLTEILCTASSAEILAIKNAYMQEFSRSLENDIHTHTSGNFQLILDPIVQDRRSKDVLIDETAAIQDAQALRSAGATRSDTEKSKLISILSTRSNSQLRCILSQYERLSGNPLEKDIFSEFSSDTSVQKSLLAIAQSARDKSDYFAERLHNAVQGIGTKDRQLIRVVVSRSEIDMQNIKRAYSQQYLGKTVETDIKLDTSGNYEKTLLALVSDS